MLKDPESGFGFYLDATLSTPLAGPLLAQQRADGSSDPVDFLLYLGSPKSGRVLRAASDPGVDQITVSVTDTAGGSGHATTEVKLATTSGGLAGATGGAALNLGTEIASLAANALEVHIRVDDATATAGFSAELGIALNATVADTV